DRDAVRSHPSTLIANEPAHEHGVVEACGREYRDEDVQHVAWLGDERLIPGLPDFPPWPLMKQHVSVAPPLHLVVDAQPLGRDRYRRNESDQIQHEKAARDGNSR